MNLNNLRDEVHANAVAKGFWDEQLSYEYCIMLVITELSEAVEADRKGRRAKSEEFKATIHKLKQSGAGLPEQWYEHLFSVGFVEYIKDSVEDELADAFIRLLDLAGARGIDVSNVTKESESDHSWKDMALLRDITFTRAMFIITWKVTDQSRIFYVITESLCCLISYCKFSNIDLFWHVEQKMKYNQSRERLHGKKY